MTSDMRGVIEPRSDQINADDFMGGPRTYRIKGVSITPGSEQPVTIDLEGSKPWRPCKSMSRLLVAAWGADANEYAGRSVTLYRDPKVKWGGLEVGGIRVSHLSHIERDMVLALTMTKGKRAPYTVKPLKAEVVEVKRPASEQQPERTQFSWDTFEPAVKNYLSTACDPDETQAWWDEKKPERMLAGADDKQRAISLATMVKDKIAALRGAEGEV